MRAISTAGRIQFYGPVIGAENPRPPVRASTSRPGVLAANVDLDQTSSSVTAVITFSRAAILKALEHHRAAGEDGRRAAWYEVISNGKG